MKKNILIGTATSLALLSLIGCGGNDNTSPNNNSQASKTTGTAFYKDSGVKGVKYSCGTQEGTTGDGGEFTFEVGRGCNFSLAGIPLRTTEASALVDGGTVFEDNLQVAKLLQSIDADANLSNGIQITAEILSVLTTALENHQSVGTLPTGDTLTQVVGAVGAVDGVSGTVRTKAEVLSHLSETKLTELLSGNTFYIVEIDTEKGKDYAELEEIVSFNNEVNKAEFKDDGKYDEKYEAKISGNTLYIMDDDKDNYEKYKFMKSTEEYIEFRYYDDEDNGYEINRFYFSEAKAKAFVNANPYTLVGPDPISNANAGDIVGTWTQKCDDDGYNKHYTEELIFGSDMTVSENKSIYSTPDCTGNPIREENKEMTYKIGQLVQADDGKDAFEINLIEANGDTYFKMFRFVSTGIIFAEDGKRNSYVSGETAGTRKNYFDASPDIWIEDVSKNPSTIVTPSPISNAKTGDIVGTWTQKCDNDGYNHYTEELIFGSDMTVSENKSIYSTSDCTGNPTREENKEMTYTVGELVQAADGKDAFEINLIEANGDTYFKMFRLVSNELIFSKTEGVNSQLSGETVTTRKNYFDANPDTWIKN